VELTDAGIEILEKVEQPYRNYIKKLMSEFKPEELELITQYMARLQHAIECEPTNPPSR